MGSSLCGNGYLLLKLAQKSQSIWHVIRAWRFFTEAKFHEQAYELQKNFMQHLLQSGYVDLAQSILETTLVHSRGTRRTVLLGNLAMVYKNQGEYREAEKLYSDAFQAFQAAGDTANAARSLHQLGNTLYVQGNHADALTSYRQSVELSRAAGPSHITAATRVQIGNCHYQCGEAKGALEEYRQALADLEEDSDSALRAAVRLQIGQIHLEAKEYLEAEVHLAEAERDAVSCIRQRPAEHHQDPTLPRRMSQRNAGTTTTLARFSTERSTSRSRSVISWKRP